MKRKLTRILGVAVLTVVGGCASDERDPVGVPEPASAYCTGIGHTVSGDQCRFPDGSSCEVWSFYRGQCGQPNSYCEKHGGTVAYVTKDLGGWTSSFAECTVSGASCMEEDFWRTGSCSSGVGLANPAATYCSALGYTVTGDQCAFPDGTSCEQWSFYRGTCGQARSFCNTHGGSVANTTRDMGGWTASYATCTMPDASQCAEDAYWRAGTCG